MAELNSRSVLVLLSSGGKYKYQRNACELSEWRKLESRGPWEGKKKNSVAKRTTQSKTNKPAAVKPHSGAKFAQEEFVGWEKRKEEWQKERKVWSYRLLT